MVVDQIARRGVRDPAVLAAMEQVPRHRFLPASRIDEAYGDHPVPIGSGQTISQPYIVALMAELADVRPGDRVLDVGTGSGYQAAVLAAMGAEVHSIDIRAELSAEANQLLRALGYRVSCHVGDGWDGWAEAAPYRAILVAAATRHVPPPLIDQLAQGGRLVVPVGDARQELVCILRTPEGVERRRVLSVLFVPMAGRAEE